MINYVIGGRGSGKTTKLIKMSAETGYPIVVTDSIRREDLLSLAKTLNFKIPLPITYIEWMNQSYLFPYRMREDRIKDVYIDNVDDLLTQIFNGVSIHTVTLTGPIEVERLERDDSCGFQNNN